MYAPETSGESAHNGMHVNNITSTGRSHYLSQCRISDNLSKHVDSLRKQSLMWAGPPDILTDIPYWEFSK